MNRSIDKRLIALEARLLRPAIVTKLSIEGFDVAEYQRLMLEVVCHDPLGWHTKFKSMSPDQQGKQKVLMFGKGWVVL